MPEMPASVDGQWIRRRRAALLGHADLSGRELARRLSDQMDGWFDVLSADLADGWALVASGGYAAGLLCPASDVDVILLHPAKAKDDTVRTTAERLWYPLWDAGLKVSPGVHTASSLMTLAAGDLVTATTVLRLRHLGGDAMVADNVRAALRAQWRKRGTHWLRQLSIATQQRWGRFGDAFSLLEPDLKEGKGGLRDVDAIHWALTLDRPEVSAALEDPVDDLIGPAEMLLAVRCELHRHSGRPRNQLLLEDQDIIADAMGFADADVLMRRVAAASRSIDWVSERFWRRIDRVLRRHGRSAQHTARASLTLQPGITVIDDEVHVDIAGAGADHSLTLRVADAAAHAGYPISKRALRVLSAAVPDDSEQWPERTRRIFLSLLGAGHGVIEAVEALERYELFSRMIPEWRAVCSLPQRNAFHRYNVDRHLLQTVANAGELVRSVARPDLLLMGALLHDIGKGAQGDHTEAGLVIVDELLPRLHFDAPDCDVIRDLVKYHLLLAETATRRDLSDPRTAEQVAEAVGDPLRLELLRALTEADSLATGPSAWSTWKAALLDELVHQVSAVFEGRPRYEPPSVDDRYPDVLAAVRTDGEALHVQRELVDDFELWTVAAPDRRGLFAAIAGALSLHGIDIVSAEAWTSHDGIAVDHIRALPAPTHRNVDRVEADVRAAVLGQLDLAERMRQRLGRPTTHRRPQAAAAPRLEVLISNDASQSTTVVEVRAPDDVAVLYRLADALTRRGLDIRAAKVATLGHEVVDVFYVSCNGGGVQLEPHRHPDLEAALRAVFHGGT